MNSEKLLAHYERMAEAPDTIARLQRFVLDLAVRGKLVEQEVSDEPTTQLIKAIATQKANFGRSAHVEALPTAEEPFPCPLGWLWSTVGEICTKTGSGSTPRGGKDAYQASGIPFLRSQNVHDDGLSLDDVAYIAPETHTRMAGTAVRPSDLLLNITGGSMGRCCRVEADFHEANVSQHVAIIRPALADMSAFLHIVVLSPYFQGFVFGEQTGAGRGGLPKNKMDRIPVPLPPLAEQHRIVAKVDELMALCDRLEEARKEREAARDRLTAASLARLNAPDPDPATFTTHARFALDNLPALTTRADQIKQLRQTILNFAVRGKLVEQDAADEPARLSLLRLPEIPAKTRKMLTPVSADENLPTLPTSWDWIALGGLVAGMDAGWSPQCENHPRTDISQWGVLKTTAVQALAFDDAQHKELPSKLAPRPQYQAEIGDILVTRAGPRNRVGISCVVDKPCPRLMISDKLIRFHGLGELSPRYLALTLNAGTTLQQVEDAKSGMAVMQMNISQDKLRAVQIPVPPIPEQYRIVAKVDELMVLCNQLEASLAIGDETRQRLLEAVLHEALEPAEARELEPA
ncbi:type I restriction enzyme S subunit [Novosphingobium sp. PhB55]|uniref:restriction endonuclease subunit S n=1 Tax=Novosphingobium sp. PhB55 TaxID=2485106 RepID=UPI0010651A14|nr:restriction endonuclease subunit S [Novosphingobium sp. PhB55]TDW62819.1 type I restriction enzyme S subunit [Novosphingobium sp. PhB55]